MKRKLRASQENVSDRAGGLARAKTRSYFQSHPRTGQKGDWLSWLERCFHTAEVTGSNPVSPTSQSELPDNNGDSVSPRSAVYPSVYRDDLERAIRVLTAAGLDNVAEILRTL